jgi:hypothetical protein
VAALLVVAVGAVGFVVKMSESALRRTATNSQVFPTHADVPPGAELCQPGQYVPAGTGNVVLLMGTARGVAGGPLDVTVKSGSAVVARGRSRGGYGDEAVGVRLSPTIRRTLPDASLCARNSGSTVVGVFGDYGLAGETIAKASVPIPDIVARLDWFGPSRQTWWSNVGPVSQRFALVKPPFFGRWTFWAVLVSLLALSAVAIRAAVREPPE